jgi:hypothetical protein
MVDAGSMIVQQPSSLAQAPTVTDEQGQPLLLDQNAIEENGVIFTPNPKAIIKDGAAYLPQAEAVADASGNYTIDGVVLKGVIVNEDGQVWAQAATSKIVPGQDGSQIVYTPDLTGQKNAEDGNLYT